jgi:hypothetical protein
LSLEIIWSLNGTHWHLADIEAFLIQLITTYKLEFLFCKWMVQNTLIDIWITSQAAVWGICPPTTRKNTICAWNLDTKNISCRFFFFLSNLKSLIRPCILKHIVEKYSVLENHEKFSPETMATYLISVNCWCYWYRTQYETYFGKTAGRYVYKWGFVFCCFVGSLSRGHLFSISVFPLFWQNRMERNEICKVRKRNPTKRLKWIHVQELKLI